MSYALRRTSIRELRLLFWLESCSDCSWTFWLFFIHDTSYRTDYFCLILCVIDGPRMVPLEELLVTSLGMSLAIDLFVPSGLHRVGGYGWWWLPTSILSLPTLIPLQLISSSPNSLLCNPVLLSSTSLSPSILLYTLVLAIFLFYWSWTVPRFW